ncbi:hypothetical protein [Agrobacterium tumefaciens]|uniref:hypothetical protein n=1 Tax=Agrobacterium tumefaciens TaxID=358 RepID=UPI001573A483|nr:hypothetical protein [Agrobacterium tumefaciens]
MTSLDLTIVAKLLSDITTPSVGGLFVSGLSVTDDAGASRRLAFGVGIASPRHVSRE